MIVWAVSNFRSSFCVGKMTIAAFINTKLAFLKRHYFPELITLFVIFGVVGVFVSIYAGQRSSLPIPYQGRLLDSNYVPVADGTSYMQFAILRCSDWRKLFVAHRAAGDRCRLHRNGDFNTGNGESRNFYGSFRKWRFHKRRNYLKYHQ